MMEMKRSSSGHSNFKSIDSIILRFPHFRDGFRNLRSMFEQYDEPNKYLGKLQLRLTKEEVEDLFRSCDIDGSEGIQFNEFIVLLCLIHLLVKPCASLDDVSTKKWTGIRMEKSASGSNDDAEEENTRHRKLTTLESATR